jgi:hypothetical protein
MTERKLKGGVLLGYFDFIKRQWGQDGLDECLGSVKIDQHSIKAESLYPLEMDLNILKWIADNKGMDFVKNAGHHTVKNLGSLSYLVKFINIKHLLKQAKNNYADAFNFGEVSILCDDFSKRAVVIMKNSNYTEETCVAWEGAFEGMMEVTRTKGTVKRNKSQVKGDEYDEFILDWT